MAPFLCLPHVLFVVKYGLEHFEISMQAQYELMQRFTAEFSIRPFLERYPDTTLALMCAAWFPKALAPARPRHLVHENFRKIPILFWSCWNCSKIIPNSMCAVLLPIIWMTSAGLSVITGGNRSPLVCQCNRWTEMVNSSRTAIDCEAAFEITNTVSQPQRFLIDLRIHFVKANGKTSPNVFKLKMVELAPRETI